MKICPVGAELLDANRETELTVANSSFGNTTRIVDVLPTQCIYVFCVDLRTNSDYFPIQH